jgi:hypothetical protein
MPKYWRQPGDQVISIRIEFLSSANVPAVMGTQERPAGFNDQVTEVVPPWRANPEE